jgi:hypothetical protein
MQALNDPGFFRADESACRKFLEESTGRAGWPRGRLPGGVFRLNQNCCPDTSGQLAGGLNGGNEERTVPYTVPHSSYNGPARDHRNSVMQTDSPADARIALPGILPIVSTFIVTLRVRAALAPMI